MEDMSMFKRGFFVLLMVTLIVGTVIPGIVVAETRAGGTIVVSEGETVDDLTVFSGTVIVRGTVEGDLTATAGTVVIDESGVVTGDVSGAASSFEIDGAVNGEVSVAAAHVTLGPTGVINGNLNVGAESVSIDGRVGGNANIGAARIDVGENASIGGDLRYDRDSTLNLADGATIEGSVVAEDTISFDSDFSFFAIPWWAGTLYSMLASLTLGAVLLVVLPGPSRSIASNVATKPLRSFGVGIVTLIVVPIALVLLALTIIGIPLTIFGVFMFALAVWAALVFGRFAIADWALRQMDVENRWVALVVGVVGLGIVAAVPIIGGFVDLVVLLLGLGALSMVGVAWWRKRRKASSVDEQAP